MSRIKILQNQLSAKNIGAMLVTNLADIRYLSGFSGSAGYMIITPLSAKFFTDGRYEVQSGKEVSKEAETIILERYSHLFNAECPKYKKIMLQGGCTVELEDILRENGVETSVDKADILLTARMVKDDDEIEAIKKQYALAADAFKKSLPSFKHGVMEKKWAATLEYNMKLQGAREASFETIVASGYRSAMPHGAASMKIVEKADPVIVDFGSIDAYASDYTRMIYSGNDKEVLNIIEILKSAIKFAIDGVKVGEYCSNIDKIARDYITSKGFGKHFNHSLGHGVGLNVHELPTLNSASENVIEDRMIFTIEPGIYIPEKFGARLEDTVLVKNGRAEILSFHLDKYVYSEV